MNAINEHQNSELYQFAIIAEKYASGKNALISNFQKLLYTLSGKAVPDNYTANHKCKSGFFKRHIIQLTSHLLGNGVTFMKKETEPKLGKDFDVNIYKAVKSALIQSVTFGFFNYDHIDFFKLTEFVPLWDEETGSLKAGIRFWKIDNNKPMHIVLYELDGYTKYEQEKNSKNLLLTKDKTSYILKGKKNIVDGEKIIAGTNYNGFPIVPLYGNFEHQSDLVGVKEQIDCFDLIKSGFANDLDNASMIYWVLHNVDGMDDVDIAKFLERMHMLGVATVSDQPGEAHAEAHTIDVPFEARETYLARLVKDLNRDFMGLDLDNIANGAATATQIRASYELLDERTDELEACVNEFIYKILDLAEIDDRPMYDRTYIVNQKEETENILMAAQYLDEQTILEKLPFISHIEVQEIQKRKANEEVGKIALLEE